MKLNEIIIIIVSVLFVPVMLSSRTSRIGNKAKLIITVLYTIFALVSTILTGMEYHRLGTDSPTWEEREEKNKEIQKPKYFWLIFLGIVLTCFGIVLIKVYTDEYR
jgi:hypothetical protein